MRILLDTHVWLWSLTEPERLNEEARRALTDPTNDVYLSAASAWEIAIKYAIGKLPLPDPPARYVPDRMRAQRIAPLAVSQTHALAVSDLPPHHSDPFDRLLISQAVTEGFELMTADVRLEPYGARLFWARS